MCKLKARLNSSQRSAIKTITVIYKTPLSSRQTSELELCLVVRVTEGATVRRPHAMHVQLPKMAINRSLSTHIRCTLRTRTYCAVKQLSKTEPHQSDCHDVSNRRRQLSSLGSQRVSSSANINANHISGKTLNRKYFSNFRF